MYNESYRQINTGVLNHTGIYSSPRYKNRQKKEKKGCKNKDKFTLD